MPLTPADRAALDEDTALERLAVHTAVRAHADTETTAEIDLRNRTGPKRVALGFNVNAFQGSVDAALAKVKPVIFGSATKIVDLMLERAFDTAGLTPAHGRRWRIDEKVAHARVADGQLPPITDTFQDLWERVCALLLPDTLNEHGGVTLNEDELLTERRAS